MTAKTCKMSTNGHKMATNGRKNPASDVFRPELRSLLVATFGKNEQHTDDFAVFSGSKNFKFVMAQEERLLGCQNQMGSLCWDE